MTDAFNELLVSLGKVFEMPLHADKSGGCALQIKKGLILQLQPDATMEKVLIICKVAEVHPGRFREDVLKEALKANGSAELQPGTFSYVPAKNTLILFQYYPIDILTGERLASLILPFIDMAESWREAILANKTSPMQSNVNPMGMIR